MSGVPRAVRIAESLAVGLVWAVLLLCVSVLVLAAPAFTRAVAGGLDLGDATGLGEARSLELAEAVRGYVASAEAPALPESVDGREGFGPDAVEHLMDVRAALAVARVAAAACAAVLAAWLAVRVARRRWPAVGDAMIVGGASVLVLMGAALFGAAADFEATFALFHSLLFPSDSWRFPEGTLLIQLFPERFWLVAGASWALLAGAASAGLIVMGARLRAKHESVLGADA